MSQDNLEIPSEGIRVFIPESGWSELEASLAPRFAPAPAEPVPESVASLAQAMHGLGLEGGRAEVGPAEVREAEVGQEMPMPMPTPMSSESESMEQDPVPEPAVFTSPRPAIQAEAVLPEQVEAQIQRLGELADRSVGVGSTKESTALVEVGEALSSFFHTLTGPHSGAGLVAAEGPSWRDVSHLTHQLDAQLRERSELAEQMTALERDIRTTRENLADLLRALAELERQNLDTASLRAQLSAMAADVISRRYSGPTLSRTEE